MPGYGYSGKPATTGWDVAHIARAWVGADEAPRVYEIRGRKAAIGARSSTEEEMGLQAPPELLGIHTNMPGIFPGDIDKAAFSGAPAPSGLSADEKVAYERCSSYIKRESPTGSRWGCDRRQLYGIADSPARPGGLFP